MIFIVQMINVYVYGAGAGDQDRYVILTINCVTNFYKFIQFIYNLQFKIYLWSYEKCRTKMPWPSSKQVSNDLEM